MAASRIERRVVIVDDSRTIQAMLDNAFSRRADFRVVGFASDADSAVAMIRRLMPDIVTIDLCMPYLDGAAMLEMISDLKTVCKIIVSDTSVGDLLLTTRLLEAGASACLGKSDFVREPEAFFKKINAAADKVSRGKQHYLSTLRGPAPARAGSDPQDVTQAIGVFPIPVDEMARLKLIKCKGLSNASRERQFDLITKHTANMTAFPACLLTVIDRDTQWVKSAHGIEVECTPRHVAFCNYTISQSGAFVVANTATDGRFSSNPLVTGAPYIKTYAGHPIIASDGVRIATLCVIDARVRAVSKHVLDQLAGMSDIIAELIDQRPAIAA